MVTTRRMAKQAEENGGVPLQSQKLLGLVLVLTGFDKNLQVSIINWKNIEN